MEDTTGFQWRWTLRSLKKKEKHPEEKEGETSRRMKIPWVQTRAWLTWYNLTASFAKSVKTYVDLVIIQRVDVDCVLRAQFHLRPWEQTLEQGPCTGWGYMLVGEGDSRQMHIKKLWVQETAVEGTVEGSRGVCFERDNHRRYLWRDVVWTRTGMVQEARSKGTGFRKGVAGSGGPEVGVGWVCSKKEEKADGLE